MTDIIDHAVDALRLVEATNAYTRKLSATLPEAAHVVAVAANGLAEAQVHATLALAEQQRIASKLTVALVDQLSAIAQESAPASYPVDPSIRIREYLTDDEWAGLGL